MSSGQNVLARIRVLVGGVPRMLSDIIARLVGTQDDMVVVGVVARSGNVLEALGPTRPDVVILGIDELAGARASAELLSRRPELKVVGVFADGRRAFMYELKPHQVPLGDLSAQGLVEAIRTWTETN